MYAQGVDVTQWERAYMQAYPDVFRGLVALGAKREEAEDALHDAFVRGLEGATVSRASGWLFIVSLRHWRRRRFRERLFSPLRVIAGTAAAEPEPHLDLFEALAALPRRQREVLVARYIVGLSQTETADALGIARGTVGATTTQALRAVRARLEDS
jgi:RNA polymerase sigma factor (sigma-70 family)